MTFNYKCCHCDSVYPINDVDHIGDNSYTKIWNCPICNTKLKLDLMRLPNFRGMKLALILAIPIEIGYIFWRDEFKNTFGISLGIVASIIIFLLILYVWYLNRDDEDLLLFHGKYCEEDTDNSKNPTP